MSRKLSYPCLWSLCVLKIGFILGLEVLFMGLIIAKCAPRVNVILFAFDSVFMLQTFRDLSELVHEEESNKQNRVPSRGKEIVSYTSNHRSRE